MRTRTLALIASIAATSAAAGCTSSSSGNATPATTVTAQETTTKSTTANTSPSKPITAADVCNLMTVADFPVQGEERHPPEPDETPFPNCSYQIKPAGGDIGARLTIGFTFLPNRPLKTDGIKNPVEAQFAGKRGLMGQTDISTEQGECTAMFEGTGGHWQIVVVDNSMPDADGCKTARFIAEKVAARVP